MPMYGSLLSIWRLVQEVMTEHTFIDIFHADMTGNIFKQRD